MVERQRRKCTARKKGSTERCKGWAIKGATCCRMHLGNPKARANAAVRAEVQNWTLGTAVDDPGETLLRLITQSRMRAERYAVELERIVAETESGNLADALVGESLIVKPDSGSLIKVGEYIRGMAVLEAAERDRCAKFCEIAIKAGLKEREIALAERAGAMIMQVMVGVFGDLGLDDDLVDRVPDLIERRLALVAG